MSALLERTTSAIVAVAATAAAAALAVGAAGFALYALTSPLIGPAGAACAVSASAALLVGLVAWRSTSKAVEKPTVGEVMETVAPPLVALAPLAFVATAFRERPLMSLGLTVLAGIAAVRQPQIIREVVGVLSHRR